ncbi:MAG: peptide ABC transporter substrate-binding protein [Chitinophagaceae bacterium]|nr:peptide ABC transporter substrate-binding protein [Anaerolineae bacterium]
MKRVLLLITVLLLAVLIAAPATAQDGKSITVMYPQELDTLNPLYTGMFFMGITTDLYLSPFWSFNDQLQPNPVLASDIPSAENGGVSEDGTVITINLRDDIFWSDGEPITSADYLFTIEMKTNPANLVNTSYPFSEADGIISSIEAPDDQTVVVTFNSPFAPWPTTLNYPVLPEHILRPVFDADGSLDNAEWNRNPTVGSGPYTFAEWEVGSFMRFTRSESYWGTAPLIDEVVITFVPDSEAYVATLLNGEAELGTFLDWSDIATVRDSGLFNVIIAPSGYNEQWNLNVNPETGHPALQDIRVRQALAQGFDRFSLTEDLFYGLTYPAASPWESTPFASPNVTAPAYDAAAAAALLDEAGWVDSNGDGTRDQDGVELVLRFVTNMRGIRADTFALAQQQYADLGIGLELTQYESDVFFGGYGDNAPVALGEYDIAQWSATTFFPDPDTSVFLCSSIPTPENPEGSNYRGYCNPELDALFVEANSTVDPAARIALYNQIDEMIAQEYIWIGIWHDPDNWEIANTLQNVTINALYPFWNISAWDLSE